MNIEGKRILVVEDDYLLAREMREMLEQHGARVVGPAPTAFYGRSLLGRRGVDFAVLDVRLHGEFAYGLADELHRRRTPFIFATALDRNQILPTYRDVPLVAKPSTVLAVLEKIRQLEQPVVSKDAAPLDEDDRSIRLARVILKAIRGSRASSPLSERD